MKKQFMTYVAAFAAASLAGGAMAQQQGQSGMEQQRETQTQQTQRQQQAERMQQAGQRQSEMRQGEMQQGQQQLSQRDSQQATLIFVMANRPQEHFISALQNFSAGQKDQAAQELTLAADYISAKAQTVEQKNSGDFFKAESLKKDVEKLKQTAKKLTDGEDVGIEEMYKLFARTNLNLSKYFTVEAESALDEKNGVIAGHNLQSASTTFRQALVWSQTEADRQDIQTLALTNAFADLLHRGLPQDLSAQAQTASGRQGGQTDQADRQGQSQREGQAGQMTRPGQDGQNRSTDRTQQSDRDTDRQSNAGGQRQIDPVAKGLEEQGLAENDTLRDLQRERTDRQAGEQRTRQAGQRPDAQTRNAEAGRDDDDANTGGVVGNDLSPAARADEAQRRNAQRTTDDDRSDVDTGGVVGNDLSPAFPTDDESREGSREGRQAAADTSDVGTGGVVGNMKSPPFPDRENEGPEAGANADRQSSDRAAGDRAGRDQVTRDKAQTGDAMKDRQQQANQNLERRQERLFDEQSDVERDRELTGTGAADRSGTGSATATGSMNYGQFREGQQRFQGEDQMTTQARTQGQQLGQEQVVQNAKQVIDQLKKQITALEGEIGSES